MPEQKILQMKNKDNRRTLMTNENYSVQVTAIIHDGLKVGENTVDQWYEVVNNDTGVIEGKSMILPEAMYLWNAYNKSLLTEQWKGQAKKEEPAAEVTH